MQDPVLQFRNERGEVVAEHIPAPTAGFEHTYAKYRQKLANRFGWDTYWWHIDHEYDPEDRKRLDMHFLRHVDDTHDGEPEDTKERAHYEFLKRQYRHEYEWACEQSRLHKELKETGKVSGYIHPYSLIYLYRWFEEEMTAEWNLLYHGVSVLEASDLMIADWQRRMEAAKSQEAD